MTAKSRRSVKRLCTKMSGKRSKRKQAVNTDSDIQHAALAHLDFDAIQLQSHRAHGERQIRPLEAKTDSQARYMRAIQTHAVTFGIGPAGTGKSYCAAGLAADGLRRGTISRLILTRPAVEAGEQLGFCRAMSMKNLVCTSRRFARF